MKQVRIMWTVMLLTGAMILSLAGCGSGQTEQSQQSAQPTQSVQPQMPGVQPPMPNGGMAGMQGGAVDLSNVGTDLPTVEYSPHDLSGEYDETGENITLGTGDVIISKGGTYIMTGVLPDGQILVEAGGEEEVQIVLNGADITNCDGPAVYVKSAGKVYLTIVGGTSNSLSDGASYRVDDDENEPDACVFSQEDLVINGSGILTVNGNYDHGIVSKDELTVTGGVLRVTAPSDGVKGKDAIRIGGGSLTVEAGDDGIATSNEEDGEKGWLSIDGGDLTVSAEGDGIHAEGALVINGGVIRILKSEEGLEGRSITVNGGDTVLSASDDGVNAAGGVGSIDSDTMQASPVNYIHVSGGSLWVNAGGDGIDANGAMLVSGGSVYVSQSGQEDGALDTGSGAVITGGTVVAAGAAQMPQGFVETSSQRSFLYTFDSVQTAGTMLTVTAQDGTEVISFAPEQEYQSVVVSTPQMVEGTYTVSAGTKSGTITVSGMTASNNGMMGGMGGPGGFGGGFNGGQASGGQVPPAGGMTPPTGDQPGGTPPGGEMPDGGAVPSMGPQPPGQGS